MDRGYNFYGKVVHASDVNPFDRSYHRWQHLFDSKVLDLLSSIFNFTTRRITTPLVTNLENYERNPNAWIVEQIVNGTCEISSTTMVLTPESPDIVDYSIGVGAFRPQLYHKARSVREEYNMYYIPFSLDVWLCLFGLLLIITAALTYTLGRETKLPHDTPYDIVARIADQKHDDGVDWKDLTVDSDETVSERERWEASEIFLVTIGALCQQGSARDPSTSAARTLLLVLFVLAVLSYTAYSASVISLISLLPSTEQEQHVSYRIFPLETRIMLQDTNFYRYGFELPYRNIEYSGLDTGMDAALDGKAIFVGDRDVCLTFLHLQGYVAERRCTLGRVFLGLEYQRVFVFRSDSTFKEPINYNILRLRQFGLLARERKKIFNVRYPCSFKERSSLSGFVSIDVSDVRPALYLLIGGTFSSVAILLLEYIIYYCSKGIKRIFGKAWKKEYDRADKILKKWQERKREKFISDQEKFYFNAENRRKRNREIAIKKIRFLTLKPIRPLPFIN